MLDQSKMIQHLGERGVRSLFNFRNAGNFREPWGGARVPNLPPEACTGTKLQEPLESPEIRISSQSGRPIRLNQAKMAAMTVVRQTSGAQGGVRYRSNSSLEQALDRSNSSRAAVVDKVI